MYNHIITKLIIPLILFVGVQAACVGNGVDPTVSSIIAGACVFGEIVVSLKVGI